MATNDFKPFATGSGANVLPQADYESLSALASGFLSGKASSAQINKALRQSSTMAALIGQFINQANLDALDNGNVSTLLTNFVAALTVNLSLGTASKRNVGTGANQIPDMSSFTATLNTPGVMRFPGGFKLMWALGSTDSIGVANVALPASFDNACFGALAIERNPYAWGAGITSVWAVQYGELSKTSVQALARQVSGGTVTAISGIGCMVLAWGN
ncbi:hypothetical protein M1924_05935 [Klebsiella pneumoniae]|nr:hypothetical protein [Klebsiella pneumoniae]